MKIYLITCTCLTSDIRYNAHSICYCIIIYIYSSIKNLQERDNLTGTLLAHYTYGHDLIVQNRPGFGTGYYHYDAQLSTRFLTDLTGTIINTYEYSAFGPFLTHTASFPNPFTYTGEWYDDETEFIYLRARYYLSDSGRFVARDKIEGVLKEPESFNAYVYAMNHPVMKHDPSGQFFVYFAATLEISQYVLSAQRIGIEGSSRLKKFLNYMEDWFHKPDAFDCFYQLFEKAVKYDLRPPLIVRERGIHIFKHPISNTIVCIQERLGIEYDLLNWETGAPEIEKPHIIPAYHVFIHTHPVYKKRVFASPSGGDKRTQKELSKRGIVSLYTIGVQLHPSYDLNEHGGGEVWKLIPESMALKNFREAKVDPGDLLITTFCMRNPGHEKCKKQ